jgi:hypothetical protein
MYELSPGSSGNIKGHDWWMMVVVFGDSLYGRRPANFIVVDCCFFRCCEAASCCWGLTGKCIIGKACYWADHYNFVCKVLHWLEST